MPDTTPEPTKSASPHYEARVDELLDRFSALVERAQSLAFPPLRKGVTAPPDTSGWSKWRRWAFVVSSPLLTTTTPSETGLAPMCILLLLLVVSQYWLAVANVLVEHAFGASVDRASRSTPGTWDLVLFWGLLVIGGILTIASYWRWVEFLRDRRYSIRWRLILTLLFLTLVILCPYWLLKSQYTSQFPGYLLQDRAALVNVALAYFAFFIPCCTFCYMLLIDLLIFSGCLCFKLLVYALSAHDPFPNRDIRTLTLEPIEDEKTGEQWSLIELPPQDLRCLSRWAAANREGTEKRLLPTVVLSAIVALFVGTRKSETTTRTFDTVIAQAVTWLANTLAVEADKLDFLDISAQAAVLALLFILITFAMYLLLALFRNLVVQSLVVEACIVAECARTPTESTEPGQIEPRRRAGGLWAWVLRLLWRR